MEAVSMRRGKFYPSTRFTPAAALTQNSTNWRTGIDKVEYRSTQHAASSQSSSVPPEVLALRMPRIHKNASDKDSIQGAEGGPYHDPRKVFKTTFASDYHSGASALSEKYVRERPAFDRLSASKTNYEITSPLETIPPFKTTSHVLHAHPKTRPQPEQAAIGGWRTSTGEYCTNELAKETVKRGGGGGEGSLGVRFNIVTNEGAPRARETALLQTGPRVSMNKKEPWRQGSNRFGDSDMQTNIITGKQHAHFQAPKPLGPADLLRPNEAIARTRPW
uniref:Uncharacterized protein n=1 Tax=Rhizochromulina marina TaxID=1034831 RepID=A0A7S2S3K8_9STRA